MTTPPRAAHFLAAAAVLSVGTFACRRSECGTGTRDEGGVCVPDLACGPGTFSDAGVCVPGVACGEGTYAMGGACVPSPPGSFDVDVPETAEPNDPFAGGPLAPFILPVPGEPPVLLGGTVQAPDLTPGGAGDLDGFVFQGAAGTLVRFTGLSGGASSVAFVVLGGDPATNDAYERWGFQGGGGHAAREVVLPMDGTYVLVASEAANVLRLRTGAGWPVGGPMDRYAVAVETFTLPMSTEVSAPFAANGFFIGGMLPVFSVAGAGAAATLHFATASTDPELEPVVLAFDLGTLALLVPPEGAADATVPLAARVLLVQDFVFSDGVGEAFTLSLD